MHRSWTLLSLAFIALISLSSVCTFPVEMNPLLRSRGLALSSSAIMIKWISSNHKLASPTNEQLQSIAASEELAKTKMHTLMKDAQDVLGIPGESPTVEYDPNSNFASALDYGYKTVMFEITGGTTCKDKVLEGFLYLGSLPELAASYRRGWIKCGVEQVFPGPKPDYGGP